MTKQNFKICTIGGGSGMPVVNQALVKANFSNINSIVTTFDSGGDTGRMRTDERGNLLAFSDYWRALISLWQNGKQKQQWEEMLKYRDGRGRNFGNIFFSFLAERKGDLSKIDSLFTLLTGAKLKGKVIPISLSPADICFSTNGGKTYKGEHMLDNLRMSRDQVKKIWLKPLVNTNPEAIRAIINANVIILCPGSMYGSIITNFLPKGMIKAYNQSQAYKILMTNIMSVANENYKSNQDEYVKIFAQYLKNNKPFNLVIMPDFEKLDQKLLAKVLKLYSFENSFPIRPKKGKNRYKTMVADITTIEKVNTRLRHSEEKLAKLFKKLIPYLTKQIS